MQRKNLTKLQRAEFTLTQRQREIVVGCILGDLNVEKRVVNGNARLQFGQSTIHSDYLNHLHMELQDLCPAGPKVRNPQPDKRTGKVYSVIRFKTYSLPCFNEFYKLFYLDGTKVVPLNIGVLLTPEGLAYWIADDGSFDNGAVVLSTDGFTLEEVQLLIQVLTEKFNLKCTINKSGGAFKIRISAESLPVLQSLLKDIMPPMMLYKIGL